MNESLEFYTSKGYGVFPYIIIREMSGLYRQIPIHFSLPQLLDKEGVLVNQYKDGIDINIEEGCISILREIIKSKPVIYNKRNCNKNWIFSNNRRIEGCVVFSSRRSVYLDSKGRFKEESESIPYGGNLISMCGEIINTGDQHFNLLE